MSNNSCKQSTISANIEVGNGSNLVNYMKYRQTEVKIRNNWLCCLQEFMYFTSVRAKTCLSLSQSHKRACIHKITMETVNVKVEKHHFLTSSTRVWFKYW